MGKFVNLLWRAARWRAWFILHQTLKLMTVILQWLSELSQAAAKACGKKIGI